MNLPSHSPTEKSNDSEERTEKATIHSGNSGRSSPNYNVDDNNVNFKNHLNDKLSKIQNSLQAFVT